MAHEHNDGTVMIQFPEEHLTSKENVPEGLENSSYYSNEQVKIHSLKPEDIVFYSERKENSNVTK